MTVQNHWARYQRQLGLPDFGEKAQKMLQESTVLIAGAGGLGSPVALYLAAAGVGKLLVCDSDKVELSNLNRQILFTTENLEQAKTKAAQQVLNKLNPEIKVESHVLRLDSHNMEDLARDVDVVVDCLDNVAGRLELNHYCVNKGLPLVHGGLEGWNGQLTFLHSPRTACLACFFDGKEKRQMTVPVMGAVAGILGSMLALEVIKYLSGQKGLLLNRMLFFDGLQMKFTELRINRRPDCPVCSLKKETT